MSVRNISNYVKGKTRRAYPSTIQKDDFIPIAYYLTLILKDAMEVPSFCINLLGKLINESGLYKRAKIIIDQYKTQLKDNDFFNPYEDEENFNFESTKINILFDGDKIIDRNYTFTGPCIDIQIDILRCIFASDTPIISSILTKIFLSDDLNKEEISKVSKVKIYSLKKVKFLMKQTGLSYKEAAILLGKFRMETCRDLAALLDYFEISENSFFPDVLKIKPTEYRLFLSDSQKLKSYGFIERNDEISQDLVNCILDQSLEPYFADFITPVKNIHPYEIDSFSIPKQTAEIMTSLLKQENGTSILLYGKPGSGKTEFAKTLGANSGYKIYIFKNETELHTRGEAIFRLNCYLNIKQENSILIVDEADSILQTICFSFFGPVPSATKGTVNKMLENNKNKVIWIVNHSKQLDESTRRRFNMSYEFEQMPLSIIRSITKSKLSVLNLPSETVSALLNLLDKYAVTGSSVDNIINTISALKTTNENSLITSVKIVLEENAKLLDGNSNRIRDKVSKSYNPNVINTSISAKSIINMVENAIEFSKNNNSTENGIRMLFYGVSGTGKTEFVRYISQKLNKKILIKRGSDILGKYVGENEQNIRNAFEEAASQDKILLFDEADSFFGNRENATQSWERTMTNEFLTQMEEFPGILVCTTNLKNIMDPAMARRFHILVEFKPMEQSGIKSLLESYFPKYNFVQNQIQSLNNYPTVTPGDFGTLSSRIRFMNQDSINSDFIIEELIKIQKEKNLLNSSRAIGF